MAIPICTTGSSMTCPHGGQVLLFTSNVIAKADNLQVLLETDVHSVVACPFTVGTKYQPCVSVRWAAGATQVKVNETPVLLQSSIGTCYSAEQAPQGVALIASVQPLASGT